MAAFVVFRLPLLGVAAAFDGDPERLLDFVGEADRRDDLEGEACRVDLVDAEPLRGVAFSGDSDRREAPRVVTMFANGQ